MDKTTEKLIDQLADIQVNYGQELESRVQAKKDERQQAMVQRWADQEAQKRQEIESNLDRIKREYAPILSDSLLYDLDDQAIASNSFELTSQAFRNMQSIVGLSVPSVEDSLLLLAVGKPQIAPNGGGVHFHPAVMGKTIGDIRQALVKHPIPEGGTILDVVEPIQITLLETELGLPV